MPRVSRNSQRSPAAPSSLGVARTEDQSWSVVTRQLPPAEQVNETLQNLAKPIRLTVHAKGGAKDVVVINCPRGKITTFTGKSDDQFRDDVVQDVLEMQSRIQQLKLAALEYLARGIHHVEAPDKAAYNWDETLPITKLWHLSFSCAGKRDHPSASQAKLMIEGLNQLLPAEFRIKWNSLFGLQDQKRIHKVVTAMRYSQEGISQEERIRLAPIIDQILGTERTLNNLVRAPLLFSPPDSPGVVEDTLKECATKYRTFVKDLAAFAESGSWYSPSYGGSGARERGPTQESVPFRSDYQRFAMKEGEELDAELHTTFFRDTEYGERCRTFLVGGGLSALEVAFNMIDESLSLSRVQDKGGARTPLFLKTPDIYFEVDHMISGFCAKWGTKAQQIPCHDVEALIKRVREEHPSAVFLNPMSNMYGMEVTQVHAFLSALCDRKLQWGSQDDCEHLQREPIYIVIDNSTLGTLARWKEINFSRLPSFVRVVAFESLVKFGQDGLDIAPAGILTVRGEFADSDAERVRKRKGFMPPETTVRRMSLLLDGDALRRKMERHSRNTLLLASTLEKVASKTGFIREVVHPLLSSHPHFKSAQMELSGAGAIFSLGLNLNMLRGYRERHSYPGGSYFAPTLDRHNFKEAAKQVATGFTQLVVHLARRADASINLGSSYGFRTTRIAAYDRKLDEMAFETIPYVRVAAGTENLKEITLVGATIVRAAEVFAQAIKEGVVLALAEKLNRNDTALEVENI